MDSDDAVQQFMRSMQEADELKARLTALDGSQAAPKSWTDSYAAWEGWNVSAMLCEVVL